MKKIFIATYGGGHANIIRAVYEKIKEETNAEITVLALTMAPTILNEANIPYVTISEMAKKLDKYDEIVRLGKPLAKIHHTNGMGIKFEDSVAYLGIGYYDLICKYGENEAYSIFEKDGRKSFLPVECMTEILRKQKPDVVIVTTSPRMEKATAVAASRLSIPVIKICDLPIIDSI